MPPTLSSAQPANLRRFADLLSAHSDALAAEGRHLDDALGRLAFSCREYALGGIGGLSGQISALARRNAVHASWVRDVADAFVQADRTIVLDQSSGLALLARPWLASFSNQSGGWPAQLGRGLQVVAGAGQSAADTLDRAAWNANARRLLEALRRLNQRGGTVITSYDLGEVLGCTLFIVGLIALEDGLGWESQAVRNIGDLLELVEQGFWNLAFNKVEPSLLLELAAEIETLHRRIYLDYGLALHERPAELGEEHLLVTDVFPGAISGQAGQLTLPASSMMAGQHSAISPYKDEQVSLFRIGSDEYLFAICGLDLHNMSASPNGLYAVIQTAYGADPMQNAYYRLVRERFLSYLEQIPSGSRLNIAGHSMGGGMTMLLLNDPQIQAALVGGGYTLASATMYGAVRPEDRRRNGIPPGEPSELAAKLFADTEVRFYIDPEDRLAMSVGAGHLDADGLPLPDVYFVDDGDLSGATAAHTTYDSATKYADLPPELWALPFQVDPDAWEHYRSPVSSVPVFVAMPEQARPTLTPAITPGPTPTPPPAPTPTPTPHTR